MVDCERRHSIDLWSFPVWRRFNGASHHILKTGQGNKNLSISPPPRWQTSSRSSHHTYLKFQTGMVNLRLVLPPCLQDQHIALKAKGQNRRGQRDVVDPASVSNLSLLLDLLWPLGLWGPYMCTCGTKGGHSFGPVSCTGPQFGLRVTRDFRSGIKQFFWAEMLMEPGLFEFYKETSRLLAIGAFKQKIR